MLYYTKKRQRDSKMASNSKMPFVDIYQVFQKVQTFVTTQYLSFIFAKKMLRIYHVRFLLHFSIYYLYYLLPEPDVPTTYIPKNKIRFIYILHKPAILKKQSTYFQGDSCIIISFLYGQFQNTSYHVVPTCNPFAQVFVEIEGSF